MNKAELKRLPLRAIVALAARCARRVRRLYSMPENMPHAAKYQSALDRAIEVAEMVAASAVVPGTAVATAARDARVAANGGTTAAGAAATSASSAARAAEGATKAATAAAGAAPTTATAAEAAEAASSSAEAGRAAEATAAAAEIAYLYAVDAAGVAAAAEADYVKLLRLNLGKYPDLGDPVDPSESGPLGPLWPDGEPEWLRSAPVTISSSGVASGEAAVIKISAPPGSAEGGAAPIEVYFDVAEFSDEEIAEILGQFSDLYHALSGDVLVINKTEMLDPSKVLVPEGV